MADARSGKEELLNAAREGDVEELEHLLSKHAAAVSCPDEVTGKKALHSAAANGHTHAVEVLLDHGADPSARNASHNTPLHFAALTGQAEATRSLLQRGADAHAVNVFGNTPFDDARTEEVQAVLMATAGANEEELCTADATLDVPECATNAVSDENGDIEGGRCKADI
jgi:ankyrin repeat protein